MGSTYLACIRIFIIADIKVIPRGPNVNIIITLNIITIGISANSA